MKLSLMCLALILALAYLVGIGKPTYDSVDPAHISGTARVVDGDALWVGDFKIRLWGIDAPEMEKGGWPSKAALMSLTRGRTISCATKGERSHNRIVALCCADGRDIGRRMVETGFAADLPGVSGGAYARPASGSECRDAGLE